MMEIPLTPPFIKLLGITKETRENAIMKFPMIIILYSLIHDRLIKFMNI